MGKHYLDKLFSPQSIALIGASEKPKTLGKFVLENLLTEGFDGPIYPVNPKYDKLGELVCYHSIGEIRDQVDLAVVATPAKTVLGLVRECGEQGVKAMIVLSAGFGEMGIAGKDLEAELATEARKYDIRMLGPNCLGIIRPASKINATFSKNSSKKGSLALVSQSGALCTAILDWAQASHIGFSAVVSMGDMAEIDFGDLLDYLAQDAETKGILLYVEGVRNARSFMSGLRTAARMKPVVVVKAGRHTEASKAAMSHTGSLVGGDDVFEAALERAGVVRAITIEQLFAAAQLLSMQHRVQGNKLAIVTNAGGPGVLATDRAVDLGVQLTELSGNTLKKLDDILPEQWSKGNPVDILGDAPPERYKKALEACLHDSSVDGVLVMLTPQAMTEPLKAATAVVEACKDSSKTVLASWMGKDQVGEAHQFFNKNGIPSFESPEASVEAFSYLSNYHRNQQLLLQVPGPLNEALVPDLEGAQLIIEGALAEGRKMLKMSEAKALLTAFHIPVLPGWDVRSASEALVAAETIGFPVVMKINSPDITHKSDVAGVKLNIDHARAVRSAFQDLIREVNKKAPEARIEGVTIEKMYKRSHGRELLVGVVRDPDFGPVVSFGSGGTAVEIHRDRAVALPPLNDFIARQLIKRPRIGKMLGAYRNLPAANILAIERVLRHVSEIACELPHIQELDINPLVADELGVVAMDVRILIKHVPPRLERYSHMAIHPYPGHLTQSWQLSDATEVTVRPIRPEDARNEAAFVKNLSPQAKYFRFMQSMHELTREMLIRFTQIDYDRELALVAMTRTDDEETWVGVARYATRPDGQSCEFAIVVSDAWQRKGIGTKMMLGLIEAARQKGFRTFEGEILSDNRSMLGLAKSLGFTIESIPEDHNLKLASMRLCPVRQDKMNC